MVLEIFEKIFYCDTVHYHIVIFGNDDNVPAWKTAQMRNKSLHIHNAIETKSFWISSGDQSPQWQKSSQGGLEKSFPCVSERAQILIGFIICSHAKVFVLEGQTGI